MKTTHILRTSVGVTCEMALDESTGAFDCQWSPPPPFSAAVRAEVIKEYLPWRDAIIAQWSAKKGLRVAIITI